MAEIKIHLQNEKMVYSGDTSCLTELGYNLEKPLPGQIIQYGVFEDVPLEWLTASISRHSITLISVEEMCAEGDPEKYDAGEEFIDPEDAYWNDFADGLLFSGFTEQEKKRMICPFPWREKRLLHTVSEYEVKHYLQNVSCFGAKIEERCKSFDPYCRWLMIHLDFQFTGMLTDFGAYDGKRMDWIFLEQNACGIKCISKYLLNEEVHFEGSFQAWMKCEMYKWLNSSFFNSSFTEEEKEQMVYYRQYAGYDLNREDRPYDEFYGSLDSRSGKIYQNYCSLLTAEELFSYFPNPKDRIAIGISGQQAKYWWFIDSIDNYIYEIYEDSRLYDSASHCSNFDFHAVDYNGDITEGRGTAEFGYQFYDCFHYLRPVIIRKNKEHYEKRS